MKAVFALYLAQAREFLRDRSSVFFVLLLPVAFGVFFGLIFSGGGFTLQMGIANEDSGPAGARFVDGLRAGGTDQGIALHVDTRAQLTADLNKGQLHVLIILPADMSSSLASGHPTAVEVLYDPTRSSSAGIGLGIVRTLLDEANLRLSGAPRLLEVREVSVQTHPLRSVDFYLPGMLGVAMLWLGIFGTAQPVVAQRQAQVFRRLSVTPISRAQMLTAEVAWRMSVGLMQTAIFLAVGYLGFRVGVLNWPVFLAAVLLGMLVFVSLGYAMSGMSRTQDGTMAIAQFINMPMMMLSGSFVSVEVLPRFLQPVVSAMPLTYLNDLLHQAMVDAPAMHPVGVDFAVLGAWLLVLVLLAVRLWRWE